MTKSLSNPASTFSLPSFLAGLAAAIEHMLPGAGREERSDSETSRARLRFDTGDLDINPDLARSQRRHGMDIARDMMRRHF